MEIVNPRCAGMDVHKRTVVCCAKVEGQKLTKTFNTYSSDLRDMGKWLSALGVTTVVMESTGVFWKPIWNLLEAEFSGINMVLANAEFVKQVPGRKTDVGDAEWLADLHCCGLIRGSRVPDRDERELIELLRARQRFVDEYGRHVLRIQKVLEGANCKLSNVVTDITGKAGMAVLKALVSGESNAKKLQKLTDTGLKARPAEILRALEGSVRDHQRLLLSVELKSLESIDEVISTLDVEVDKRLRPFEEVVQRLDAIPGISQRNAQEILGYAGPTLENFKYSAELAAWAGLCPGNNISAGKSKNRKARRGNSWLKSVMVAAAWPAIRTKSSYFRELYHRKKATRGSQKAIVAVAHSMLVTIFHMVKRGTTYRDLGPDYQKIRNRSQILQKRRNELSRLGYAIEVTDLLSPLETAQSA